MKNTKRSFAAVALAGLTLALSGAPHAAADTLGDGGLLNALGTAGAADNREDDSTTPTTTIIGNSGVQSIG